MGYIVPNTSEVAFRDQAEVDSQDFRALGDRSTGVLSGGVVTAQAIPSLSVQVSAGLAIINGTLVSFNGVSVTVQPPSSTPRFDLVVVEGDNDVRVLRGTTSTNPVFPVLGPGTQALLAALFVRGSAESVTDADIVRKDIAMEPSFRRSFSSNGDVFLSSSAPAGSTSIRADGEVSWGSNVLRKTASLAMEFVTTLKVRAVEAAAVVLMVQARETNPDTQRALDITSSSGTSVASVSGTGVLTASNFRNGTGSPEGAVAAPKGTLYVDVAGNDTEMLWIKTAGVDNTGWLPVKITAEGDETFPVGTVVAILGSTAPAGWMTVSGQSISTSDPATAALAALVGSDYGSGSGFVILPDLRGYILIGAGGDVSLPLGEFGGSSTRNLSISNLPFHAHDVEDPGHEHPQFARMLVYGPIGGAHPDGQIGWSVAPEPTGFDRTAPTGVTVQPTGGSEPVSIVPPVFAVTWIVKL